MNEKATTAAAIFVLSVFCSVVVAAVSAVVWMGWHAISPMGSVRETDRVKEAMFAAYDQRQYHEVLRLYESPIDIWLGFDERPSEWTWRGRNLFKIAESYRETGNRETAHQLYLAIVGWSKAKYDSYCRLNVVDCSNADALRNMASVQESLGERHTP